MNLKNNKIIELLSKLKQQKIIFKGLQLLKYTEYPIKNNKITWNLLK